MAKKVIVSFSLPEGMSKTDLLERLHEAFDAFQQHYRDRQVHGDWSKEIAQVNHVKKNMQGNVKE